MLQLFRFYYNAHILFFCMPSCKINVASNLLHTLTIKLYPYKCLNMTTNRRTGHRQPDKQTNRQDSRKPRKLIKRAYRQTGKHPLGDNFVTEFALHRMSSYIHRMSLYKITYNVILLITWSLIFIEFELHTVGST